MRRRAEPDRGAESRKPWSWWITTTALYAALAVCGVAALLVIGPALAALDSAMSGLAGEALIVAGVIAVGAYLLRSRLHAARSDH